MSRDMENVSNEGAEKAGWKIIVPFDGEVVGKATFEGRELGAPLRIMKSTKRFKVEGGWIYNTTTEIHFDLHISVAEALVFVPDKI